MCWPTVRVHCDAARGKYEGRKANGDPGRKVIGSARCHARSMRGITAAPFDEVEHAESASGSVRTNTVRRDRTTRIRQLHQRRAETAARSKMFETKMRLSCMNRLSEKLLYKASRLVDLRGIGGTTSGKEVKSWQWGMRYRAGYERSLLAGTRHIRRVDGETTKGRTQEESKSRRGVGSDRCWASTRGQRQRLR